MFDKQRTNSGCFKKLKIKTDFFNRSAAIVVNSEITLLKFPIIHYYEVSVTKVSLFLYHEKTSGQIK